MATIASMIAKLTLDSKGFDAGCKDAAGKAKQLVKELKGTFGEDSLLGSFGKALKGAGMFAGLYVAANLFKGIGEQVRTIAEDLRSGTMSAEDIVPALTKSIPLLGQIQQGAIAIMEAFTGSQKEADALNKKLDDGSKLIKEWKNKAALAGMEGDDKKRFQAELEYREAQVLVEKLKKEGAFASDIAAENALQNAHKFTIEAAEREIAERAIAESIKAQTEELEAQAKAQQALKEHADAYYELLEQMNALGRATPNAVNTREAKAIELYNDALKKNLSSDEQWNLYFGIARAREQDQRDRQQSRKDRFNAMADEYDADIYRQAQNFSRQAMNPYEQYLEVFNQIKTAAQMYPDILSNDRASQLKDTAYQKYLEQIGLGKEHELTSGSPMTTLGMMRWGGSETETTLLRKIVKATEDTARYAKQGGVG